MAASAPSAAGNSNIEKVILECQPFKDGAATLVCVGCFKMLTFPNSARKIKCGFCGTECGGVKIRCTSCKCNLQVKLGTTTATCKQCGYSFQPMSTLKIGLPDWAKGSHAQPLNITLNVVFDGSLGVTKTTATIPSFSCVPTQPLSTVAAAWEEESGVEFRSVGFFKKLTSATTTSATKGSTGKDGEVKLDGTKTLMGLGLVNGDTIIVKRVESLSNFGHEFLTSQFAAPTNCAKCNQFIWGIYNQGKKCARCGLPVHHRCAEGMTQMCEADRRAMFGIVNFNDGEDEEEEDQAIVAVVVEDADRAAFSSCVTEKVAPECDPNFMKSLNNMSLRFTDEQIQELWVHYDTDGSGSLEMDEMKTMLSDLVGAGGGKWDKTNNSEEAAERMMARMDTNHDGTISWEEFWYFFKAQQDNRFLSQFQGSSLTQDKLYELWYHYDTDGSGTLEVEELLLLLADIQSIAKPAGGTAAEAAPSTKLASLLKPDAHITWEEFYKIIVPQLKLSLQ